MSKSATFERSWGYHGGYTLLPPPTREEIERHIAPNCQCGACQANRAMLASMPLSQPVKEESDISCPLR